ncbi:MAG: hypothetical protein U9O84_00400 [Chloroflexota bacterium]|nr:hypothetical protein [Chloroflexota bacterium]
MRWIKRILISIALLVVVAFGSVILYGVAYGEGEAAGYDSGYGGGYSTGQEAGYSSGRQDGYNEGHSSGKAEGYTEGYDEGFDEGVEAGLGHGYSLRDPTYRQALDFLRKDKTDRREYIEDTYVCSHFARDVCNNAGVEGLRCAYVGLIYPEGGHAIIALETIDRGLVYFDPQTDEKVNPVLGKLYYQCVVTKEGYYYEKPSFDDTIQDILVVW